MNHAASARMASDAAGERTVHVIQGDYAVVSDRDVVLSTILGSCVAACMHDPVASVGGMNHFLLPGDEEASGESMKYGVNAMELLINGLLQRGAMRSRIQAKLFGGGNVMGGLSDIGAKNAAFGRKFLQMEGIACVSESLGGDRARRLRYWPATGRASQFLLDPNSADAKSASRVKAASPPPPSAGAIELF